MKLAKALAGIITVTIILLLVIGAIVQSRLAREYRIHAELVRSVESYMGVLDRIGREQAKLRYSIESTTNLVLVVNGIRIIEQLPPMGGPVKLERGRNYEGWNSYSGSAPAECGDNRCGADSSALGCGATQ